MEFQKIGFRIRDMEIFLRIPPRYMTIQILQKRYRVDCRYQSHIKKDEDFPFLCTVVYYRILADNFLNLDSTYFEVVSKLQIYCGKTRSPLTVWKSSLTHWQKFREIMTIPYGPDGGTKIPTHSPRAEGKA